MEFAFQRDVWIHHILPFSFDSVFEARNLALVCSFFRAELLKLSMWRRFFSHRVTLMYLALFGEFPRSRREVLSPDSVVQFVLDLLGVKPVVFFVQGFVCSKKTGYESAKIPGSVTVARLWDGGYFESIR
jgi:hypothetical protein